MRENYQHELFIETKKHTCQQFINVLLWSERSREWPHQAASSRRGLLWSEVDTYTEYLDC